MILILLFSIVALMVVGMLWRRRQIRTQKAEAVTHDGHCAHCGAANTSVETNRSNLGRRF